MHNLRAKFRRCLPGSTLELLRAYTTYQRLRHSDAPWALAPFERHECLFIHIPKTGGLSVKRAAFGLEGGPHISARTFRRIYGSAKFNRFFKFAFVRNPWDRLVSAYFFLAKGGIHADDRHFARKHLQAFDSFEQFVFEGLSQPVILNWVHFRPQADWLTIDNALATDYIGRFESLAADYEAVRSRLGFGEPLPQINASKHHDFRSYYNSKDMVERVAEIYHRDVDLFSYHFE